MKKYNISGNVISEQSLAFDKYCITLMNNERVYIYTLRSPIEIIDWLTENKNKTFIDTLGFQTTVFRKHIVKITEVK